MSVETSSPPAPQARLADGVLAVGLCCVALYLLLLYLAIHLTSLTWHGRCTCVCGSSLVPANGSSDGVRLRCRWHRTSSRLRSRRSPRLAPGSRQSNAARRPLAAWQPLAGLATQSPLQRGRACVASELALLANWRSLRTSDQLPLLAASARVAAAAACASCSITFALSCICI